VKDAGEQTEYVADVVGVVTVRTTSPTVAPWAASSPQLLPTCGAVTDDGPEDQRVRGHPTK